MRLALVSATGLCLLAGLLPGSAPPQNVPAPVAPTYKSPFGLAIDARGERAWVALHTAGTVAEVDLTAGKVLRELPVGKGPHDVALHKGKVLVSCAEDDVVAVLDAASGKVEQRFAVGQAPQGLAVLPEDGRVVVACHDDRTVAVVDRKTGRTTTCALPGWPSRVALLGDVLEPSVLVLSTDPGKAVVSVLDPFGTFEVRKNYVLEGVTNARGLAGQTGLSASFFVAHQKPKTNVPTTQIAQGWVFTNTLTTFFPWRAYLAEGQRQGGILLDTPQRGFADPSDVVTSPDQRHVFVACAGADQVLAMRTNQVVYANYNWGVEREDLSLARKLTFARLPTGANPRRLALSGDGRTLVTANYLDDSLTVIDVLAAKVVRTISLQGPPPNAARRGEILFHSNRMTHLGQFTCNSCHPGGQSDGLNWDLTRDGVGNFMNTRSLRGVKDTAPYGWYGTSPTLDNRVTGTLRTLHHHEPTAEEAADLVEYLKTLTPPRPLPAAKTTRVAADRGKVLFHGKAGCYRCHSGDTLQDGLTHNIGTRTPQDTAAVFDTPSLRGVARTAPYLHDGRADTLEEVFTRYNPDHRHGLAHQLTPAELGDLVTYLKSL